MKILKKDYRKGFLKIEIENLDDLWYLSYVIDVGDIISSKTERKIKIGGEDQRNAKVVRKKVWLKIECEKIQFSSSGSDLRISGKIAEGTDDVSAGDYHTIEVSPSSVLDVDKGKKGFLKYQVDRIEEASKNKPTNVLLCAIDRGEAIFALLKKYGYEIIGNEKGEFEKKDYNENIKNSFFSDVAKRISEYSQRYSINTVVVGSIPFWKDSIKKEIDGLGVKVLYAVCSSSGENALNEMIKNDDVKAALKDERFAIESSLVNDILSRISKGGNVAYGVKEVKECSDIGAVEKLLVTDKFIQKKREDESYQELEDIMRVVDSSNGEIVIVSSEHESGEQLDGLGGIAATLRYKV